MSRAIDWIDRTLGRLIFRAVGLVCALVALTCAYAVWSHLADWQDYSLVPVVMFGLVAVAAGAAVPYCFSHRRTFAQALDAMEGGAGDTNRGPPDRP